MSNEHTDDQHEQLDVGQQIIDEVETMMNKYPEHGYIFNTQPDVDGICSMVTAGNTFITVNLALNLLGEIADQNFKEKPEVIKPIHNMIRLMGQVYELNLKANNQVKH